MRPAPCCRCRRCPAVPGEPTCNNGAGWVDHLTASHVDAHPSEPIHPSRFRSVSLAGAGL